MRTSKRNDYVARQLAAKNIALHYWESDNTAEVDFIACFDDTFIPMEVKSAENVRARNLQAYVKKYSPAYSDRISPKNFGFENKLYAVFCL